ncbi:MAG: hypothetical protein NVSMB27_33830 [Ktedonobacteraceae bacterium]
MAFVGLGDTASIELVGTAWPGDDTSFNVGGHPVFDLGAFLGIAGLGLYRQYPALAKEQA